MNTGRIPTRPSLVHCKFVLIQFPSVLLAQVQPECQFSHMYLSYHSGRGLVEIPDERWLYIHSSKFGTLYKFVLIQFPSLLLAQVQPECQFSHISPTIAGEVL